MEFSVKLSMSVAIGCILHRTKRCLLKCTQLETEGAISLLTCSKMVYIDYTKN